MEFWKHDSLYDEINGDTEQSATHFTSQVKSNPFDFEGSHDEQFSMVVASPNSQNELYALPNMSSRIPDQMGNMPYEYLVHQQHETSRANKKSANPFDETNMSPSTMPSHPT